jgi:ATP-dependent RNA helicase DeaD
MDVVVARWRPEFATAILLNRRASERSWAVAAHTSVKKVSMSEATSEEVAEVGVEGTPEPGTPKSFDAFPIGSEVRAALADMGYEAPMEVQSAVIGPALAGRDLVVQAKTGSGKTTAFGIPICSRLETGDTEPGRPRALVLTPTRELALQVATELRNVGAKKGTKVLAVYGGVPMGRQIAGLKTGAEVVVGTPGRLLDHIRRGNLSLVDLATVVLDEADEMLSMGFWDDVTDLLKMTPDSRQTMLFSATLPYQVARAAAEFLRDPERLDLSGDLLTVEGISNCIYHVLPDVPKPRQLLYVLETEQPDSAIIFCNTRNEAEMIAKFLTQSGLVAEALTGSFRQKERERVMKRIKEGSLRYMVATDVAARGIDIDDLSHVVLYSLPEFSEVYLHRVGRTGRVGKVGNALCLVDGKGLGTLSVLEREFEIQFEERKLPPEDEVMRRRSERIMKDLSEKASVAEVGQHLSTAQEIIGSDDGAQVVAFLLKAYFNRASESSSRRSGSSSSSSSSSSNERRAQQADANENGEGRRGRRRRRRPRRSRRTREEPSNEFAEAQGESSAPDSAFATEPDGATDGAEGEGAADRAKRLRVNIGFDDGFKGRGAVAKKISALAGLNDGIVKEVESKREYAVLKASPDIAELVIERVDGAQLGKKTITVHKLG